jgi:hypothetical protein
LIVGRRDELLFESVGRVADAHHPEGEGSMTNRKHGPARRLLAAGLAALWLAPALAGAAEPCARPADKSAFDVAALKSRLMITALTCDAHDKYNDFVTRYRAALEREDKVLDAYFTRAYGRAARKQHDDYTTLLANTLSEQGLKQGTQFCDQNLGAFSQVMALHDGTALPDFAASQAIVQPVSLTLCPTAPATKPKAKAKSQAQKTQTQKSSS